MTANTTLLRQRLRCLPASPADSGPFPRLSLHRPLAPALTYEVLPGGGVVGLLPGAGPGHQHRVVLHAPQAGRLDEVGEAVPQVGRHHHVAEALGALRRHGRLDVLEDARGGARRQEEVEEQGREEGREDVRTGRNRTGSDWLKTMTFDLMALKIYSKGIILIALVNSACLGLLFNLNQSALLSFLFLLLIHARSHPACILSQLIYYA